MQRRSFLCLSASLAAASACSTPATANDELAGVWRGTWERGGQTLRVALSITRTPSGYAAAFDSEDLQVAGIPFAEITRTDDAVVMLLRGDETTTTFEGRLSHDMLAGRLREGETEGVFNLRRDADPPPALRTRDVEFVNDDVRLSGTIISPEDGGPFPAIVFVHGSGPEGRWASRYLAQRFAERGFAALIFDKRGVGGSGGDWRQSSLDDLAADAAAGVALLRTLRDVDGAGIGVYGHSQGSSVAALLAPQASLRFVIGGAATGQDPAETEIFSVANSIGAASLPPAERADAEAYVREIVAVAYDGRPRAALDEMSARFARRAWHFPPPPADHHYWSFSRQVASYEPRAAWARVDAPVLLIWGERDERVYVERSVETLQATLRDAGNNDVTVRVLEAADHSFRLVSAAQGGWPQRPPGFVDLLLDWSIDRIR